MNIELQKSTKVNYKILQPIYLLTHYTSSLFGDFSPFVANYPMLPKDKGALFLKQVELFSTWVLVWV